MADQQAAAIAERMRVVVAKARNALALEIAANLAETCPVDTGHARANFVPSIGFPYEAAPDDGSAASEGTALVATSTSREPAFVTNNVPYMPFLVAGSSDQAAPGWDLKAIDEAVITVQAQYQAVQIDVGHDSARNAVVNRRRNDE